MHSKGFSHSDKFIQNEKKVLLQSTVVIRQIKEIKWAINFIPFLHLGQMKWNCDCQIIYFWSKVNYCNWTWNNKYSLMSKIEKMPKQKSFYGTKKQWFKGGFQVTCNFRTKRKYFIHILMCLCSINLIIMNMCCSSKIYVSEFLLQGEMKQTNISYKKLGDWDIIRKTPTMTILTFLSLHLVQIFKWLHAKSLITSKSKRPLATLLHKFTHTVRDIY